jgi:hypothetical protein
MMLPPVIKPPLLVISPDSIPTILGKLCKYGYPGIENEGMMLYNFRRKPDSY